MHNNIVEKLVFGADAARRAAKDLKHKGLHQQAAEQRERAKTMELVLLWIDNGVPLR
ncbi:hypothetical protein [Eoetvoesiella caeni]